MWARGTGLPHGRSRPRFVPCRNSNYPHALSLTCAHPKTPGPSPALCPSQPGPESETRFGRVLPSPVCISGRGRTLPWASMPKFSRAPQPRASGFRPPTAISPPGKNAAAPLDAPDAEGSRRKNPHEVFTAVCRQKTVTRCGCRRVAISAIAACGLELFRRAGCPRPTECRDTRNANHPLMRPGRSRPHSAGVHIRSLLALEEVWHISNILGQMAEHHARWAVQLALGFFPVVA